jgi:hypothetical protein
MCEVCAMILHYVKKKKGRIVNLSPIIATAFVVLSYISVGCIVNYELSLLILCLFGVFNIPYF